MTQITTGANPKNVTVRVGPWRWPTKWSIVDLEGATRNPATTSRRLVREVLLEAERDHPGWAAELLVFAWDQNGDRFGAPQRGDEFLAMEGEK